MQVQSAAQSKPTVTPPSQVTPPAVLGQMQAPPAPTSVVTPPSPQDAAQALAAKGIDVSPTKVGKGARKKQIPTVIGLLVLFVSLVSGVLLFGQGTGVFAPRATPQTTPQNIRISNVTDKTFTVSFFTDESTVGFVKYGVEANDLDKQASDDRDQLSGIVKDYRLHHITVRGLEPATAYHYVLGTGSSSFDNEGVPYVITTATKPNQSPANNQTVYGNVMTPASTPAEGAIVYLYSEGIGGLSSLVKASGSFGISLSTAFNAEKTAYADLTAESMLEIRAQGIDPNLLVSSKVLVADAQPVADLILTTASGSGETISTTPVVDKDDLLEGIESMEESSSSVALAPDDEAASTATQSGEGEVVGMESGVDEPVAESTDSGTTALGTASGESGVVTLNLDELEETAAPEATVIETTQPQIKAKLPANTVVRVVIHSDTQIDESYQTDAEGNLVVDVAALGKDLEPGEHTASYSYIDPVTGEEVTKTYSFTVAPNATRQLAQANIPSSTPSPTTSPTPLPSIPHGSGNPFVPTAAPTITVPTATATPSIGSAGATVSTTSGQYSAGSVGTTIALLLGGVFFVIAGVWSYVLAGISTPKKSA